MFLVLRLGQDFFLIMSIDGEKMLHLYNNVQNAFLAKVTSIIARLFLSGRSSPAAQGGTMHSLSSLWLCATLPGLLWASQVSLIVERDDSTSRICKPAPHWDIKGQAPMQELLGKVVVVALLKAS